MLVMKPSMPGRHLYVIRSRAGVVKIGRSSKPRNRLADLQTGSGHKLILAKTLVDRGPEEKAVHAACAKYRLKGEWFQDTTDFRSALSEALGVAVDFLNRSETWREEYAERNSWDAPRIKQLEVIKTQSSKRLSASERYARHLKRHWPS